MKGMTQEDEKQQGIFSSLMDGEGNEPPKKESAFARVRRYFLTGIVVTAPIAITIYLTYAFFNFIDNTVTGFIPPNYYPETYLPGIGVAIALLFFLIIGWFATNFLGKIFLQASESVFNNVPIIRTLYGGIKQIMETVMASKSQAFRHAVLLEYPRKGTWAVGFVTGKTEGEVQDYTKNETINVFVPTTPNPTSGFLLFVPKKDVQFLDMTVEEAVKLVVSAGIITPLKSN